MIGKNAQRKPWKGRSMRDGSQPFQGFLLCNIYNILDNILAPVSVARILIIVGNNRINSSSPK